MSSTTYPPCERSSRHSLMEQLEPGSVTLWITDLKGGDEQAAQQIWERYFGSLTDLARAKLNGFSKRASDEEDVALSVIDTLCRGARHGRFPKLQDRDDLWRLLLVIARQKVVDHKRWESRKKRGGNGYHHGGPSIDEVVTSEPTPEFLAQLEDQRRYLFGLLRDDTLRQIAAAKLEGYSNAEIAESLGVSPRTVQRKVKLIHEQWTSALVSNAPA